MLLFPFDISSGERPITSTVDVPENIRKAAKTGDINIFKKIMQSLLRDTDCVYMKLLTWGRKK